MELKKGKMTNKELAEWFGMSQKSFKKKKRDKLKELEYFAAFHEEKGKVIIEEVYDAVYSKQGSPNYQKVRDKVDKVWSQDGLDSCARVGQQIFYQLEEEEGGLSPIACTTVIDYTRKSRNELYGKPFMKNGKIGTCIYTWCKRDRDTGEYSFLSPEEQEIKQDLQMKYFGDATEKQVLVKAMVERGEITSEEAWGVLEDMTNMKTGNFMAFLEELQQKLGCQVVKGTLVDRTPPTPKLDWSV